jgi:predicted ATPase
MFLENILLQSDLFPIKDSYPFNLPVFNNSFKLNFSTPITFFVGENGCGKSTLLQAITKACGIHIWQNEERSRIGNHQYEEYLHDYLKVTWKGKPVAGSFFGSDIFKHFAEILDAWAVTDPKQLDYFGGRSLTTLSHGQSLMAFFRNRYRIKGIYFLDEPETALSPRTQIELLNYLDEISQMGHAQFIIASHSPILLSSRGARIYNFDQYPIEEVKYHQTDHYILYKDFISKQT